MTKPYVLHRGDVLEVLRTMADNSVDSIVTDPPYELGFMGKSWDASGIAYNVDMWREALRVLKPGGHLLAFSGSRTYHRMTCAIEDAGFEVRDQIMWVYGQGFPKSLDVSKAIDKAAGAEREVVGEHPNPAGNKRGGNSLNMSAVGMPETAFITAPATDAARQWEGWGTALKPAHEPICVARKPLVGTVAANVLEFGTGALNIDACRIETTDNLNGGAYAAEGGRTVSGSLSASGMNVPGKTVGAEFVQPVGRWPANLIHDGSPEVVALFPDAKGQQGAITGAEPSAKTKKVFGEFDRRAAAEPRREDDKSAARFFYCAKASRADRNEGLDDPGPQFKRGSTLRDAENLNAAGERKGNHHATVKPTDLMAYLCRLVTPPGGKVLDLFFGSGSTGKACMREGFEFIGIDKDEDENGEPAGYLEIATARIEYELARVTAANEPAPQLEMFT